MSATMRAIRVHQPGGPEVLQLETIPVPEASAGWVRIRVYAFGLNRSELYTRQGHSPSVQFPRVLGIECVGVVDGGGGTDLVRGDGDGVRETQVIRGRTSRRASPVTCHGRHPIKWLEAAAGHRPLQGAGSSDGRASAEKPNGDPQAEAAVPSLNSFNVDGAPTLLDAA